MHRAVAIVLFHEDPVIADALREQLAVEGCRVAARNQLADALEFLNFAGPTILVVTSPLSVHDWRRLHDVAGNRPGLAILFAPAPALGTRVGHQELLQRLAQLAASLAASSPAGAD